MMEPTTPEDVADLREVVMHDPKYWPKQGDEFNVNSKEFVAVLQDECGLDQLTCGDDDRLQCVFSKEIDRHLDEPSFNSRHICPWHPDSDPDPKVCERPLPGYAVKFVRKSEYLTWKLTQS